MPSNIQYNSPMPIYSRETAEEQYRQQVGAGPNYALGASDRHFDPEKSEALKAIKAGEADEFGHTFNKKIVEAETPHVPPPQEPYWAQAARSRSERARSTTPSVTYTTPSAQHYAPRYSTLQHSKRHSDSQRSYSASKKGYEFGGLDYVDKSRIPQAPSFLYHGGTQKHREERRTTPGYEMGGMDFRKEEVKPGGPYHGHGPQQRRLQSKFERSSLKHDQMNIEVAPNVDQVSADTLVGDTRSNQHLAKDEHPDHAFGTSFGPTVGFTHEHRTVHRQQEPLKPTTFSLSAKKGSTGYKSSSLYRVAPAAEAAPEAAHQSQIELAGYTSQAVANYMGHGTAGAEIGTSSVPFKRAEPTWTRSQSAAPVDKYQWADNSIQKEVTIETLLNGRALLARKRSVTPEWQSRSLEKHDRWKNRSDPRLSRSQTYEYEPTWSRIVSNRRNAWEEKARNTDARVQMPPSSKIPPQQRPQWYNKANQTHILWQNEAYRQGRTETGFGDATHTSYDSADYGGSQRRSEEYHNQKRHDEYVTGDKQAGNYDGFISQKQYTSTSGNTENAQRNQAHYNSYPRSQLEQYTCEQGTPASHSTHKSYSAVPAGPPQTVSSNIQQQTPTWKSQSGPEAAVHDYHSSSSRFEQQIHERSSERTVSEQSVIPAVQGIQKTSYQRRTHQESTAPLISSVVSVTQGTGSDFSRQAEMAEVLPRGTVANTEASTEGNYVDNEGRPVMYKRELMTSVNPKSESTLLKEEERRVVETPLEPGVISRHVTTKYYKKKTVTDTTTTNTVQ